MAQPAGNADTTGSTLVLEGAFDKIHFREILLGVLACAEKRYAKGLKKALLIYHEETGSAYQKNTRGLASGIVNIVMRKIGGAGKVRQTVRIMDKRLDSETYSKQPAYHNILHSLDAAIVALALATWEQKNNPLIKTRDLEDLGIAAFLHDEGHPGGGNGKIKDVYQYFRIENDTLREVEKILGEGGYEPGRLAQIRTIILATEPVVGPPLVNLAFRYHQEKAKAASSNGNMACIEKERDKFLQMHDHLQVRELCCKLFADPKLAVLAEIMTKADIAFSLLTPETYYGNTVTYHQENEEKKTGLKFINPDGSPIIPAANYFFAEIAMLNGKGPYLLESTKFIEKAGKNVWSLVQTERLGREVTFASKGEPEPVKFLTGRRHVHHHQNG
jgi:hypothetical protein